MAPSWDESHQGLDVQATTNRWQPANALRAANIQSRGLAVVNAVVGSTKRELRQSPVSPQLQDSIESAQGSRRPRSAERRRRKPLYALDEV